MEQHDVAWFQDAFGKLKIDFQTRRGRLDNEVLAFRLPDESRRVTYLRVDQQGVTVAMEGRNGIYANWHGGDRFERMYHALFWMNLPAGVSSPQMKWDDYSAWEVVPPLPARKKDMHEYTNNYSHSRYRTSPTWS